MSRFGGRNLHWNQAENHAPANTHKSKVYSSVEAVSAPYNFLKDLLFLVGKVRWELAADFFGLVRWAAIAIKDLGVFKVCVLHKISDSSIVIGRCCKGDVPVRHNHSLRVP